LKPFPWRSMRIKGQAATLLNLILAIFLVLVLGFFSVELNRYFLATQQLKADVEAAALCAEVTLASTGNPDDINNQNTAEQAALSLFQQNSILGQALSSASIITLSAGQTKPQFDVPPGQAQICFQFLDPLTHLPANNPADPTGKLIQATGAYSYVPAFGKFIGLGNAVYTVEASANSGVPQLDLVFVYDVSGPQNDQTPVTFVQRFWHDPYGIDYLIPSSVGTQPPLIGTGGPLWPVCATQAPNQGPNPVEPQSLDNGKNCPAPQLNYAESATLPDTQLLTGSQAWGAPPGNYPPPNSILVYPFSFVTRAMTIVWGYLPVSLPGPFTQYISLSQYYPAKITDVTWEFPSVSPGAAYGNVTDFIVYMPNGSGFPATPLPGITLASGFSSLSNYQATITLQGYVTATVTLGGGSSYGALTPPLGLPTGPHPAIGPTGGSPVKSMLSGFPYDDYGHIFTDCITNIDGNAVFKNFTVQYNGKTYKFPSLATLVEASRGNLESLANAQAAGLNLGAMGLTAADLQVGYYAAYVQAALAAIQPMNTMANATIAFMNQLSQISDAHYGCLTFNDYSGTDAASTAPPNGTSQPYNLAASYPYPAMDMNPDGTFTPSMTNVYSMPDILLNPNGNNNNLATITNILPTIHTWGNCDVAGGLTAALAELDPQIVGSQNASASRAVANKVIILVTSQAPNIGSNGDTGAAALNDALAVAKLANQAGIPIYCVSLAQSANDDTNEDAAYNDSKNGIAAVAGHGSKYYRIDWSNPATTQSALTTAFANIARRLVTVVY